MKRLRHLFEAAAATQPQTSEITLPTAVEQPPAKNLTTVTVKAKPKLAVLQPASAEVLKKAKKLGMVPAMACNVCAIAEDCPEFTPGDACHFDEAWSGFETRSMEDIIAMQHDVVASNFKRFQRAKFMEERVHGGMIDPNVSRLGKDVLEGTTHLITLENSHRDISITSEVDVEDEDDPFMQAFMGASRAAEPSIELNPPTPALPEANPVYTPPDIVDVGPGQKVRIE